MASPPITQLRCAPCGLPWILEGAYDRAEVAEVLCRYCGQPLTWVQVIRQPPAVRRSRVKR